MIVENLAAFMFDFGEPCTIAGTSQVGIFDKSYQQQFGMVAGSEPVLLIKDSALESGVEGSTVVVRSTSYTITSIEPDGTGMTILRLELL